MKAGLAIAVWLCAVAALSADEMDLFDQPHLSMSGTGDVNAKPDMATITVGVVTEADSASAALDQNNARMEKLFDNLKERGIAEKDLQTTNFSVSPKYQHHPPRQRSAQDRGVYRHQRGSHQSSATLIAGTRP